MYNVGILVIEAIEKIKADTTIARSYDEARIKNSVILNLLFNLGWDVFNVQEITPEYPVGSGKVDYALITPDQPNPKVFIEVKRPTENLETHQQQLLDYCFTIGVKISVLTNGFTWWFYLPLLEGSWEQRRFYTIDINQQLSDAVAQKLNIFLSKENVKNGQAYITAIKTCESGKKKTIVKETLPKAWGKIVSEPDESLLILISQTTEQLCGFSPEVDDIADFIHRLPKNSHEPKQTNSSNTRPSPSTSVSSSPKEDYINTKIKCFYLFENKYFPKTWQELLETVAKNLYSNHVAEFDRCLGLRGTKMRYFSKNPNELSVPKRILDSDFYFEAKLNSNSIVKRARELMRLFGCHDSNLKIEIESNTQQ